MRDAAQPASTDPLASADMFETALGWWRGAAFADVLGEPFVLGEATRLEEMRLTALKNAMTCFSHWVAMRSWSAS